jgi:radical SAM superfamily enzyme YgiQ (UPF0313 family)
MYQEDFLKAHKEVDYILCGEYEMTLLELARAINENKDLSRIPGLIFYNKDKIIKNKPRELIENLDILPFPDRDSLPIYNYLDLPSVLPQPPAIILSSRGCPFHCSFCLWNWVLYGGPNYRVRDLRKICEEIEILISKYNFKSIYFDDDTFNINESRLIQFANLIKDFEIPWAIMARPDLTSFDTWELLKKSGLKAVKFGIETCNKKFLKIYYKNLNLEKAFSTIKFLKSINVKVHLTFMISFLDNTDSVKELVNDIKKLAPDSVQFSYLIPFPGTPVYRNAALRHAGTPLCEEFDSGDHPKLNFDLSELERTVIT